MQEFIRHNERGGPFAGAALAFKRVGKSVNLLLYSHSFAPDIGGVETFSRRLATELPSAVAPANSVKLTVVTKSPDRLGENPVPADLLVIRRPSVWKLRRLIGDSDVVLLAGPAMLPLFFGLVQRKAVVVTHHGYQTICPNGLLFHYQTQACCPGHFRSSRYLECIRCCGGELGFVRGVARVMLTFLRRFLCLFSRYNVSVSQHLAHRLSLPASVVIHQGVPQTDLPSFARPSDPPRFVYVGRMVAEKGVGTLIEAAGILKARGRVFQVLLVGDGPLRSVLEGLSLRLGLHKHVSFLGFKTGKDLRRLLDEASACVIPTVSEETAGFSALEQMMAGKAIIASEIGALPEEIGESGLTFSAGKATELADCMERLIVSPGSAESLGRRARERAMRLYDARQMIGRYVELLRSL